MLRRRSFLASAATGVLAAGCYPKGARGPKTAAPPIHGVAPQLRHMLGLREHKQLMLGYPVNMATPPEAFFAWRRELARVGLDEFAFNNVGNPDLHSHFPFNSHPLEREVIARFAALVRFSPDDAWGFVSNSGTDSNMHGLYMGRTILRAETGVNPKIYFTKEAHYSIQILADLLALDWIPVATLDDGAMDPEDLGARLAAHPDHPALVVATVGTTFKGAVDSIDSIQARLAGRASYLHVDAALFGGYLPHTEFAAELHQRSGGSPDGASRYDSLAVSCHKFFGFASPAGLFVTTRSAFERFLGEFAQIHDPAYLLQVPGTITCSRDAVKPGEFLFHTTEAALARQRADAEQILAAAAYLHEQMQARFPALDPARAGPMSNTIYFEHPGDELVSTYSLATATLEREGRAIPHAHVIVMPHATREVLDGFLADLERSR